MNLPDFLTQNAQGDIRLTGHRIGLYHLVDRYQEGSSPEQLHEEFPSLSPSLIHQVIAFYWDNRAEVDAYVAGYRADLERQEAAHVPSAALLDMRRRLGIVQGADSDNGQGSP